MILVGAQSRIGVTAARSRRERLQVWVSVTQSFERSYSDQGGFSFSMNPRNSGGRDGNG
jgi:hypothetical protein